MNIRSVCILALLLLAPRAVPAAPGDVFIVDGSNPEASDSNPGTESEPWKTIQKAAESLQPGETVLVKEGIYTELTSGSSDPGVTGIRLRVSGTPENRISFRNYPGHMPIIDQQNTPRSSGFLIIDGNPGYITIEGFEIRNAGYAGIFFRWAGESRGFVISKNHIHHIDGVLGNNVSGVNNWGAFDLIIENNIIHDISVAGNVNNGNASGIGSYEAVNMSVKNNRIYNAHNGIFVKRPNRSLQPGSRIERNLIHNVHNGVRLSEGGANGDPHVDEQIVENIIFDVERGVFVDAFSTQTQNDGVLIKNNTIIAKGHSLHLTWYRNVEIYNNIMWSGSHEVSEFTYEDCLRSVEFSYFNNNMYAGTERFRTDGWCGSREKTYYGLSDWREATGFDTQSLTGEPGFVSRASQNFELLPDSPAIAKGRGGENLGAYPAGIEIIGPLQTPQAATEIVVN